MVEVLREEIDTDHRYRITRTEQGFLLSSRQKDQIGLLLGPAEWLYRTCEAANKGLDLLIVMNAWWMAMTRGYPVGDLPQRCEAAAATHNRIIDELHDQPLIGEEVRGLRKGLHE